MQKRRMRWVGGVVAGMLVVFAGMSLLPIAGVSVGHEAHEPHDRIETVARDTAANDRHQAAADATAAVTRSDAASRPTLLVPKHESLSEREALRRQILASAHAHAADEPQATHAGPLTDRTDGADPALLAALNTDFMPLANECMTAAKQADPELRGMVAMGLELAVDDELGAVVEIVEFPDHNEVDDPELQTCLRETALSMILPPATGGLTQLLVTLPLDDGED